MNHIEAAIISKALKLVHVSKNECQNGVEVTKEEVKELRTILNEFHRE